MTLSVAQKEAYARAHTSSIRLWAIELRHPTFVEPLRIVAHKEDLTTTLESNAPVEADQEVTFVSLAMKMREPEIGTEADSMVSIQIDGVPGAVQPYLAAANKTIYPIEATLRVFLYNLETESIIDSATSILHLQVRNIGVSKTSVTLTMGYTNTANRAFPSQLYTPETNPGLV